MGSSVLRYGLVTICYREARFITPFLKHLPDWIDEVTVLNSTNPWFGAPTPDDGTAELAAKYAKVIQNYWATEEDQRNTGQSLHQDKDWVIIMDPDEFLDNEGWANLKQYLETTQDEAVVVEGQNTYWKRGYVADPPRDYQMLIAVRPWIPFVEKRIVGIGYGTAPVWLHHFSWAKTSQEVYDKITHYAHANDFDTEKWFREVWEPWEEGVQDVHPTTPETLHNLVRAVLPPEIEELHLWPPQ